MKAKKEQKKKTKKVDVESVRKQARKTVSKLAEKPSRKTVRKPHKKITAEKKPRGRPKKVTGAIPVAPAPAPLPPSIIPSAPSAVPPERKAEISTYPPPEPQKVEAKLPKIKVNEFTTVREIAEKISISPAEIIKKLLSLGTIVTINQRLEPDIANLIAHEFGYEAEFSSVYQEELEVKEDVSMLVSRAPIVTVMGHVDHGKTTLLDTIRKSRVVDKEFGGITQHIGAYKVKTEHGEIVFLDTPGHETFTAMRAHGAKVTDIVVLVVAADDGVMPQTIEAINHARAAAAPIIVAVNKIDLPGANPEAVKNQLAQYNLIPDTWGGDTLTVEISARNDINIDKLLEAILFKAELLELKANPSRPAKGIIIESQLSSQKGPLATVLVQTGTLKIGDAFISGLTYGKVRAMIDVSLRQVNFALPSTPVEVLGFSAVPVVGEKFIVVQNEQFAKEIVGRRQGILLREKKTLARKISLEDLSYRKVKQLNVIIKTDFLGSLHAIKDALERFSLEEVKLNIVHSGVGAINLSDVNLAVAASAIIIGFNVRPDTNAEEFAKSEGIEIRTYRVIYELMDDIKKALEGLLEPKKEEKIIGHAEIKKIFTVSGAGTVAGCLVTSGKVARSEKIRLLRDNVIIFDGATKSLKRFKDDVKEVEKGYECGILLENFNDIKVGDILEFYTFEIVKQ